MVELFSLSEVTKSYDFQSTHQSLDLSEKIPLRD